MRVISPVKLKLSIFFLFFLAFLPLCLHHYLILPISSNQCIYKYALDIAISTLSEFCICCILSVKLLDLQGMSAWLLSCKIFILI